MEILELCLHGNVCLITSAESSPLLPFEVMRWRGGRLGGRAGEFGKESGVGYSTQIQKGETMKNLTLLCFVCAALGALALPAGAEPYWITYEGNDLPENEGWERNWGNWDGPHEGDGAIRTVEDGILTCDTRFDTGVYDYSFVERPGSTDPGPGEMFVMEWRALIEDEVGEPSWDTAAWIASDDGWQVCIGLRPHEVVSAFEHGSSPIPIEPGVFHDYRLVSSGMRSYEFYIDGNLARAGGFWRGLTESRLWWGPVTLGASSLSHWDYVRVGVIPEPASCFLLLLPCVMWSRRRVIGNAIGD
jgi:hypothetical protein